MDGSGSQKDSRERLYARAPSRASTASSANTQMTPRSANSSSSLLRDSTQMSAHPTHKYHHNHCGRSPATTKPSTRLSRETSHESGQTGSPGSSYLQERLQRERKERQMMAKEASGDLAISIGDLREGDGDLQSSPGRRSTIAAARKPQANSEDERSTDDGISLRHVEKAVSTLHKQNFDLKLELFHRRERQTMLEEKVEKLEADKKEMDEDCQTLAAELDKKDKAVDEAVAIIHRLEAQVYELVREREMVRQVEADGSYQRSQSDRSVSATAATPKMKGLDLSLMDAKSLERMPSFLSEPSEDTENLRDVVLQKQSSYMHMRKVSESSADPSEINRITSPSLSVLSESSFVSIYGSKSGKDKLDLPPLDDVVGMDSNDVDRSPTPTTKSSKASWESQKDTTASHTPKTSLVGGGANITTRMRSLNDVLDGEPPLQRPARIEKQVSVTGEAHAPSTSRHSRRLSTPTPGRSANPPPPQKSKQDKREALNKVLTNYPTHKELANSHTLPPTPDTVSSTTLRRHQHLTSSQDSLMRQKGALLNESLRTPSETSAISGAESDFKASSGLNSQPASTTAFSSRKHIPGPVVNPEIFSPVGLLGQSLPRRPRSVGETTSSLTRADSFISESDSDGGVDAQPETGHFNYDYWMRESMKPIEHGPDSHAESKGRRSPSPDLFSFPTNSGRWASELIFGAMNKGDGVIGSPVSALKRDPVDELTAYFQGSQAEAPRPPLSGPPPPTPSRRSSYHARTGSTSATPSLVGKLRNGPTRGSSANRTDTRSRSNTIDSGAQVSGPETPSQYPEPTAGGKRNPYPPISGQQPPRGRSLGLNSFFRRSGSESYGSVPSSATETTFSAAPQPRPQSRMMNNVRDSGRNSVPAPAIMPWARPPGVVDDDYKSATPPPIMRNRVPKLVTGMAMDHGGAGSLATPKHQHRMSSGSITPTTVVGRSSLDGNTTLNGTQSSGKRRWLSLGKMGSMKNRTG